MLREQPAKTTRSPGDQHSPLRIDPPRQRQNVLTDMSPLAHETKRLPSVTHIPPSHRQRPQHTPLEQRQQLVEHLPNTLRTSLQQVKRSIAHTRMSARDLTGIANIGLAHLNEPATVPQQPKRRVDELTSQTIQHDIHTAPARELLEAVTKLERARGRDVILIQPHPPQDIPLTRTRRREHLDTEMTRQLYS